MTSKQDQDHLLEDVISESISDDFREATLQGALRLVRRRRRYRQTCRSAGVLAAAIAVGFIGYALWPRPSRVEPVGPTYEIIQTHSLPTSAIISSKPLDSDQFVVSQSVVRVVHTEAGDRLYRIINDDELLDLVANRSALLVRLGPTEQKLTFANEVDQQGFPLN